MSETSARWAIVIHGGAGVIAPGQLKPEQEAAYRASLERIIRAGGEVLARGGPALDAVEAAVRLLEDDPLYNAGRGAVFTAEGRNELDAAIMEMIDTPGPVIFDCVVDQKENCLPMIPSGKAHNEMILPSYEDDIGKVIDEKGRQLV